MGKFVVKKTLDDGLAFTIVANNGEVVGVSQAYRSRESLNNGIESVRRNANVHIEDQTLLKPEDKTCPKWEIYMDNGEEYRFRLKASNGEIILAASEGYTTKVNAKKGIESIQANIDSEIVRED